MEICLIGCGKMGSALLKGWSKLKTIKEIKVIEPNHENISKSLVNNKKFNFYNSLSKIKNRDVFDVTILAVKPQIMKEVVTQLAELKIHSNSWLSIAAGLKVNFFEEYLGKNQSIIRTIPNTPSSILKGVTAVHFNSNCNKNVIENSILLMDAVGETIQVQNEELMDSYTAVSGSGPAYIYYMIEAMIKAAIGNGISPKDARVLAEKTLIGSAYLLEHTNEEVHKLRKDVTSPKGTTRAVISMASRIRNQMNERTQMLAGVSHDLRTPLTRLRLQIAMLPRNNEIVSMEKDIEEMELMISEYLSFAKDNVGEAFSKVNLHKIFREIVEQFKNSNYKIKLNISFKDNYYNLRPQSFKRAVVNILTNAKRYSKYTEILIKQKEDTLLIFIDDDGPGIKIEDREDALKPFHRLETSRNKNTGGTGLGLSIANNITLSHGGSLELLESPLGGLRVKVSLPI